MLVAALVSTVDKKAAPGNARLDHMIYDKPKILIFQLVNCHIWDGGHDRRCHIFLSAIDWSSSPVLEDAAIGGFRPIVRTRVHRN
jgi:hypothetical protein